MKHTSRLLILSCLSLSCTLMSCNKEEVQDNIQTFPPTGCGQELIPFNSDQYNTLMTDPSGVVDIRLEQTCLIVDFAYSGCDEREVGVMAYLDYTPFVPVLRAKINSGPITECLAFIMHTDTFDLSSSDLELYDGITLKVFQWDELLMLDLE